MKSISAGLPARRAGARSSIRHRLGSLAAILVVTLSLAGCGFHLMGASPLPEGVDRMYVSYSDDYQVGDPPLVETLMSPSSSASSDARSSAPVTATPFFGRDSSNWPR